MDPDQVVQLPRGRHGLSREQVATSQRLRILAAIVSALADKGYVRTTVADIITRARLSRETFYQHFADKEDCFLAAYDTGVELMVEAMDEAADAPTDAPIDRFGRALAAYLQRLADEPAFARTFLIEVYAAGPRALAQRMTLQGRFVDLVAQVFGARSPDDRFVCEALVAAISSLVTTRVGTGAAEELPALHAPLMMVTRRMLGDPFLTVAAE